ncbi:hypothetical protein K458DRAFT_320294 [Lentithecium fluviatile CBS 122367]|uniref:Uncharacterized protein n=1 Tax=Lentithecium fluviatile CBS 122367 TaxID=1168545 RepID=A0A6G1IGC6_9PLEO|nr:hypothetical protein K458DRAFT_320294 [Lentithecium fluviatile CBS 122367]
MRFIIPTLAVLSASAVQGAAIAPRIDGCPPLAPWPMGNPGTERYHICCAYTTNWNECCNRDNPQPIIVEGKALRACTDSVFYVGK